jgi:hypothetical protein
MKFSICFTFLYLFVTVSVLAANDDTTGPRMSFSDKSIDFGEIISGEVVEHVYRFENTGTDTLRIATVYSS